MTTEKGRDGKVKCREREEGKKVRLISFIESSQVRILNNLKTNLD